MWPNFLLQSLSFISRDTKFIILYEVKIVWTIICVKTAVTWLWKENFKKYSMFE